MLQGCTPWPDELAARWKREGWWEGLTLWDMVARTVARSPEKTAVVAGEAGEEGGEFRQTYAELDRAVARVAAGWLALGLRPLDRVVMQLPNTPEFVHHYLALVRIGAIPVMALRAHRLAEVRHFVRASGAVAYVGPDAIKDFDYRPMAAQVQRELPHLRHVVIVGTPREGQVAQADLLARAGDDASIAAALAPVRVDAAEVTTMLLSGGTTSMSKLIPRTHEDYVLNARLCGAAAGFSAETVFMAILPLGHNYNLASPGMLATFYYGGTLVIAPSTDTAAIFGAIERERVTVVAAVVPLIAGWLTSPEPQRFDTASLRVIQNGGARLAPELRQRLRERFPGCTPQEVYGTAEGLINMVRLDDADELVLDSSGAPVCAADEIRVVDDQDRDVADGEPGELLTRGPYTIRGYYNAEAKNREAFTADGWYRMGDIVRKRGRYVYTEGRRKDLINRGGEKISCEEVENLIFGHPAVLAVTLVAMPDPVFGEKACAFVIPKVGHTLTLPELTAHLRAQGIASFKLPERLELVDAFPTSPVGKIMKRELRERIAAQVEQESQP